MSSPGLFQAAEANRFVPETDQKNGDSLTFVGPSLGANLGRMAALVILTVDKHAADAGVAHLGEGDLPRAGEGRHAPIISPI
jgi:hypothetical protein